MDTQETATSPSPTLNSDPTKSSKRNINPKTILPAVLAFLVIGSLGAAAYTQYAENNKVDRQVAELNKQVSTLKDEKKKLSEDLVKRQDTTGEVNIDKANFQSVFFKNGQVYFGKITKITETQVTLTNIYYLRGTQTSDINNLSGDVSLVKLGEELHGPQDAMYIERKEVNFWENLKSDGQVAKAITEYEKQNKQ